MEDIPKNLTYEEQILNYERGEVYIWVKKNHANDLITLNKGTCLVEIQVVSKTDINNWKKSEKNFVNNINYPNWPWIPPINKSISSEIWSKPHNWHLIETKVIQPTVGN